MDTFWLIVNKMKIKFSQLCGRFSISNLYKYIVIYIQIYCFVIYIINVQPQEYKSCEAINGVCVKFKQRLWKYIIFTVIAVNNEL
jgi:hypothetical protein